MITYTYQCKNCGYQFDTQQSIKVYKKLIQCPQCLKDTLNQIIYVSQIIIRQADCEVKTVGQLAERNTAKMSKEDIAKHVEKLKTQREGFKKLLPKGASLASTTTKKNRSKACTLSDKEVTNLNNSQKEQYIKTGVAK